MRSFYAATVFILCPLVGCGPPFTYDQSRQDADAPDVAGTETGSERTAPRLSSRSGGSAGHQADGDIVASGGTGSTTTVSLADAGLDVGTQPDAVTTNIEDAPHTNDVVIETSTPSPDAPSPSGDASKDVLEDAPDEAGLPASVDAGIAVEASVPEAQPPDDGECNATGIRLRVELTERTRTVTSVQASFRGASGSYQEVCGTRDNLETAPVYGCCVSTRKKKPGDAVCLDIILRDLANNVIRYACPGSNPTAPCGDWPQYRVTSDGSVVSLRAEPLPGTARSVICFTQP